MDEEKKKVDEAWKEKAETEKKVQENSKEPQGSHEDDGLPEQADFSFFITTLAIQASIALGAVPNPVTQKVEENLAQAKLIIDTLGVIKEKTQGNLTTDEDSLLDNFLYELRMQYIAKTEKPGGQT